MPDDVVNDVMIYILAGLMAAPIAAVAMLYEEYIFNKSSGSYREIIAAALCVPLSTASLLIKHHILDRAHLFEYTYYCGRLASCHTTASDLFMLFCSLILFAVFKKKRKA
jgi:hypothetical protein